MAKTTYTWYTVLALAFVSSCMLGGIAIIGTCGYDFAQIVQEEKLSAKIKHEIEIIRDVDCNGYKIGGHLYIEGTSSGSIPSSCLTIDEDKKKWEGADTYKLVWILCLIAAMILGFIQFAGSVAVISSCNTARLRSNIKAWAISNIFVFLLGLLCILIPMSYNVDKARHFNFSDFSTYMRNKFFRLIDIQEKEEWQHNLYFYVVGCNEVLLLFSVLFLTSLLPCGTNQPYNSVEN